MNNVCIRSSDRQEGHFRATGPPYGRLPTLTGVLLNKSMTSVNSQLDENLICANRMLSGGYSSVG